MKNIFSAKRIYVTLFVFMSLGTLVYQLGGSAAKSDLKHYVHQTTGFSFSYPALFSVSSFGSTSEEGGETILIQSSNEEKGLQVLITPFDEDVALTEARIHDDIPDLTMSDVSTQTLGSRKKTVQAVVFTSTNSLMGKSREAWFVYKGLLYQISAPENAHELFDTAIDSLEF